MSGGGPAGAYSPTCHSSHGYYRSSDGVWVHGPRCFAELIEGESLGDDDEKHYAMAICNVADFFGKEHLGVSKKLAAMSLGIIATLMLLGGQAAAGGTADAFWSWPLKNRIK